jgi:hypothetical protein
MRIVKLAGRGFALGLFLILVFGYYVFTQVCANTVIEEMFSPDNTWKVVIFERSCGSFTGNSTQISILKSDAQLQNDAGNIYVAEGYPEGYFAEWLSDASVKVSGVKGTNHLKVEAHEGISVIYE